jgi:hypothetical protein
MSRRREEEYYALPCFAFEFVFYLTASGRREDGHSVNLQYLVVLRYLP